MNNTLDMTKGSIYKILLIFSIPLLIGNIFQLLYSLIDSAISSHLIGSLALGAIGATAAVNSLIISFSSGMGSGASIIISRFFGEKNNDGIKKSIASIIIINIILALIITLGIALTTDPILEALNVSSDIYQMARDYFIVTIYGLITTMMFNTLSGILRALGN